MARALAYHNCMHERMILFGYVTMSVRAVRCARADYVRGASPTWCVPVRACESSE